MLVRFQYADGSVWEGPPEDARLGAPDPRPLEPGWVYEPGVPGPGGIDAGGIIRMIAISDDGRELIFAYHDFYYLRPVEGGGWEFGSGGQSVTFILRPGEPGTEGSAVPIQIPAGSIVRVGVTLTKEDAIKFGLVGPVDPKDLHAKSEVVIVQVG